MTCFAYFSSRFQFFITLTVLGIYTRLQWEAEEGQAESRDSHTGSMTITASCYEIGSVLKFLGFLENMVLGETLNCIILRTRTIVLHRNLQKICRMTCLHKYCLSFIFMPSRSLLWARPLAR